jgi:two-component system phosphate regulon sensor histidine kinase PhoR
MRKTTAKYALPGLILLMSVSLAGIILVQYFWIRNAISVKEALFDQAVNDALVKTIAQLKKDRDVQFVTKQLWVGEDRDEDSYRISLDGNGSESIVWSGSGSGSYVYRNSDGRSEFRFDQFHDSTLRSRTLIKLDSLQDVLDENNVIVLSEMQDTMELIVRQKITEVQRKSAEMDEVIEDMVIELKSFDAIEDQVPDTALIRKRLRENLSDQGLHLSFEVYVTKGKDTDDLITSNGSSTTDNIQEESFTSRLYPESLFGRDELLVVEFPGKNVHILRSMGVLMTGSGLFTTIVLITFFVTIRIIIRQKKLSEIKSDFINNMTHEFKTPIATISLALDSINNPGVIGDPEKIRYFTGVIGEENKRMNSNVENVLQISLIDKKDFDFRIQETNVEEILSDLSKKFELQLKKRKGSLHLDLNANDPVVMADPDHLANILSNLIDNAIKYTNHSPDITVRTNSTDSFCEIEVKDKGIGMTREEQAKIFDKFYRVPQGDIHNIKGFGLGLSYVKAVVLALGGTISVKSQPSRGSVFRIRLPKEQHQT